MVDHEIECLLSLVSFLVHLFNVIRKAIFNLLARQKATHVLESGCKILEDVKMVDVDHVKVVKRPRKRPTMIVIPEVCVGSGFLCEVDVREKKDLEVEGSGYCVIAREGKRSFQMEDGYGVITNINGNSKEAFFGVFDGHGGRAAVDFVSENLGKNIIKALSEIEEGGEDNVELAIRSGYLTTDTEFLNQGSSSGACASTVLLKNGELHVSNVGDCRVVMSLKGEAYTLTSDHNPKREDERSRVESLGGYVSCNNGRWRVQDSLAVTRAIGDANLKQWIISEPESAKIQLTSECEFLIIASDGLWDKVTDQEAVNVVLRHDEHLMKSCKELVEISHSRGSRDDITVMVVDLAKFV